MMGDFNVAYTMSGILGTMIAFLMFLTSIQKPSPTSTNNQILPDPKTQPSKNAFELYTWRYTAVWIFGFGCIVVFQLYEVFTAFHYNVVCIGLSLPFLLQPILYPKIPTTNQRSSPDAKRPLTARYAFKANLWLAIFSFIGNYWYTHYFYSVLKAKYTFPAHRLNDVPICLYFATHFYFSTYHAVSNACLRRVETWYAPGFLRQLLFVSVIFVLSYFTAFMETLTISSFPYYSFEDRDMAYTIGSAFYGIYFLASFPMFYYFDDTVDNGGGVSVWRTVVDSCACGMIVMCLLDFVRLFVGVPLVIGKS